MPKVARSVVDVLLGEAVSGTPEERYQDLVSIASAIKNRSDMLQVSPQDVVGVRSEFNAYGKALPSGVEQYRSLAEKAWNDVEQNGPIHSAAFYSTPATANRIANGKTMVAQTKGHVFYNDPNARAIRTAKGWKKPDPALLQTQLAENGVPVPEENPVRVPYAPEEQDGAEAFDAIMTDTAQPEASQESATEFTSPFGPLGDRVTSDFGARERPRTPLGLGSSFHQGTDMSLGPGVSGYPAQTIGAGVIQSIDQTPGYGNRVTVQHPDGTVSSYSHLQSVAGNLGIGDEIAAGTPVGEVGNTGRSQASHLHLEVRDPQGNVIDPASLIDFNATPSVPAPLAADRVTPGQMVSDIANAAVQPSMGDPNAVLAQSFDMGRFGEPQAVAQNFDTGRFGDPVAQSFDTARFGFAEQPQGMDALAAALQSQQREMSPRLAFDDPAMVAMQQRAVEARKALEQANMADVPEMGDTPPVAVAEGNPAMAALSGLSTRPEPSMGDMAAQYGLYGAGRITPEQNLAADVFDQQLATKVDRGFPSVDVAQTAGTPSYEERETRDVSDADPLDSYPDAPSQVDQAVAQRKQEREADAKPTAVNGLKDSLFNSKTAGTLGGAALGALLGGPLGAAALGTIGGKIGDKYMGDRKPSQSPGQALASLIGGYEGPRQPSAINNVGTGVAASYRAWSGQGGDQGVATDGSVITNFGGGLVQRTDPNGVTTTFRDGRIVDGGDGFLSRLFGGNDENDTGGVDTSGFSPGLW